MDIYLPIAEMTVPVQSILALGLAVGFLSGVFGVGGGFLATPFLIFMGVPPAVAVGTQGAQLVAASVAGVLGHWRRGNVDFRMGGVMLAGGALGSMAGIGIFHLLRHFGQIDLAIAVLYVVLLGSIGSMMLAESMASLMKKPSSQENTPLAARGRFLRRLPLQMRFPRSKLYVSALVPAGIGFIGGLLVSIMGIGGGFLLVPAMIYILGMPTLLVAGTSLFQIMLTGALSTLMHAQMNQTVDFVLAAVLILGGVVGAQMGVLVSRRIRGAQARIALAMLVLIVSIQLAGQLLVRPLEIYTAVSP
ncbi:MAG: sulfite exporter TauE/SafE family protein [Rhodospirillales bacterium]|nr:sulfite exporter TauE/SafE family protein [Rhodospirillales bacterium]